MPCIQDHPHNARLVLGMQGRATCASTHHTDHPAHTIIHIRNISLVISYGGPGPYMERKITLQTTTQKLGFH